ncbi:MAG: hypothetical protein HC841_05810 [Verrucomicrobiae bacterium]|nr:hypothetical protein [Verrucomicrobiae bacterium]
MVSKPVVSISLLVISVVTAATGILLSAADPEPLMVQPAGVGGIFLTQIKRLGSLTSTRP